ncbi:helix-turn-helix domain-containing protein [Staphylococcus pasteuri]|uniref:helix-turn-helix domain-containing protein n=1 Tax=Staphylococcus pasteuri TaxID=45972 RepID=UPI000E3706B6|nr:helix-turn-helix transcriptional regulator [Staphylococcus pasteuri]RFD69589.1 hypothetical protein A7974_03735 [Staphylococcus pasteuri]
MELRETLATNLRMAVAKRGMSNSELAFRSKVSHGTVVSYKNARSTRIDLEKLHNMAQTLDVEVSSLFKEVE